MTAPAELAVMGETFDLLLGVRDALGESLGDSLSADDLAELTDLLAADALELAESVLECLAADCEVRCALRRSHVDPSERTLTVARNIVKRDGQKIDKTTKNRRRRVIALDDRSLKLLTDRAANASALAEEYEVPLDPGPYLFAVDLARAEPWDPDTISQFFGRLRVRVGYEHLEFKGLRAFMDTYGQELGFSRSQVAIRAGHDPAVAARHYTGKVPEADRRLADSMADLLMPDRSDDAESQEILG